MTKLSRREMGSEQMEGFINHLCNAFTNLREKEEVKGFLKELLSITELKMLAKRWRVACLLTAGRSYQDIKNQIGVQNSTIAKVNNVINGLPESQLKKIALKLSAAEKIKRGNQEALPNQARKYTFGGIPKAVDALF